MVRKTYSRSQPYSFVMAKHVGTPQPQLQRAAQRGRQCATLLLRLAVAATCITRYCGLGGWLRWYFPPRAVATVCIHSLPAALSWDEGYSTAWHCGIVLRTPSTALSKHVHARDEPYLSEPMDLHAFVQGAYTPITAGRNPASAHCRRRRRHRRTSPPPLPFDRQRTSTTNRS